MINSIIIQETSPNKAEARLSKRINRILLKSTNLQLVQLGFQFKGLNLKDNAYIALEDDLYTIQGAALRYPSIIICSNPLSNQDFDDVYLSVASGISIFGWVKPDTEVDERIKHFVSLQ